jgi:uncharacterized protein (TIGR03546 family)
LLRATVKLIKALNGNAKKSQIAAGFAWGLLLGLVPAGNFFWVALLLLSFFFNHNHGSKLFSMALLKLFAPIIAPAVDILGWQVLHIEAFQPLFTTMFNMPFVPFTKFNNTLVAGGLVAGAVLWLPVFFASTALIPLYRNHLSPKIRDLKVVKAIGKLPFFAIIDKAISSKG